jgi:hypothetical protein
MRELDRIKKERAEEAARVEAQKRALEEKQAKDAALAGNPLLLSTLAPGAAAGAGGAVIKRRCVSLRGWLVAGGWWGHWVVLCGTCMYLAVPSSSSALSPPAHGVPCAVVGHVQVG